MWTLRAMSPALVLLFSGCQGLDYGIAHPSDGWTPGEDLGHLGTASSTINISFGVVFQRNNWGDTVRRCQVQVAFTRLGESDGMGMGDGSETEHILFPEEVGWCQTTRFDDVDDDSPIDPRDEDHDPDPGPLDNWNLRGSLDAGCRVWLHGEGGSWPLDRQIDSKDRVTYKLAHCDEESFPFGEVLDLEIDEADAMPPLAGLRLEEAFRVGFPLEVEVLLENPQRGIVYHRVDNPFLVAWHETESNWELPGGGWDHEELAFLRVSEFGVHDPVEVLVCRPHLEDDEILFGPSQLLEMPHNHLSDSDKWSSTFQVDSRYIGPALETPWGEILRVESTISNGGILVLFEEGDPPEHTDESHMPEH